MDTKDIGLTPSSDTAAGRSDLEGVSMGGESFKKASDDYEPEVCARTHFRSGESFRTNIFFLHFQFNF